MILFSSWWRIFSLWWRILIGKENCNGWKEESNLLPKELVEKILADTEQSNFLPEELVEKIIAMIPFPFLLKARCLSKSWKAKFEPVSSLSEENDVLCATSFHKEVAKWSNRWPTVSPVFATNKGMIGYDHVSRSWRKLPKLVALLEPPRNERLLTPDPRMEGALLCKIVEGTTGTRHIFVFNILTEENKLLPTLPQDPDCEEDIDCLKIVSDSSSGTYKLIVSRHKRLRGHTYIHVYDSKSEEWSESDISMFIDDKTNFLSCAYLDGVLYLNTDAEIHCLLAFNVEEETMTELWLSYNMRNGRYCIGLVICNDNLFMIVTDYHNPFSVSVLHIDLESLRVWEVARLPKTGPTSSRLGTMNTPPNDIHCIFIEMSNVLVTYDQHKDEWRFLSFSKVPYRWSFVSFRPGLNPFMVP